MNALQQYADEFNTKVQSNLLKPVNFNETGALTVLRFLVATEYQGLHAIHVTKTFAECQARQKFLAEVLGDIDAELLKRAN